MMISLLFVDIFLLIYATSTIR